MDHLKPESQFQEELTSYDVIDLPSNGILYKNKISKAKVSYLNALDESILTSPNIMRNGKFIDILIKRKVKDLGGLDPLDLLSGDRMAIILFLRTTGFGPIYKVPITLTDGTDRTVMGEIDLSLIKPKPLLAKPDENGEFEYKLPMSGKLVKFRLLTGKDESDIDLKDEAHSEFSNDGVSEKSKFRLESMVMEIDGIRDKLKISSMFHKIPLGDSLSLKTYYNEIEPGLDLNVEVRIPGGDSIRSFLPIGANFFWI